MSARTRLTFTLSSRPLAVPEPGVAAWPAGMTVFAGAAALGVAGADGSAVATDGLAAAGALAAAGLAAAAPSDVSLAATSAFALEPLAFATAFDALSGAPVRPLAGGCWAAGATGT